MILSDLKANKCPRCSGILTYSVLDATYTCSNKECGHVITQKAVDNLINSTHRSFGVRKNMSEEDRLRELNNFGHKEYSLDYSDEYGKRS